MLTEEINYIIVNPSGKIVAAYPDLKTAQIDAEDLTKDLPDKLVHIYTVHNRMGLDENEMLGTHNYYQVTYKHYSSHPMPPEDEEPEPAEDAEAVEPAEPAEADTEAPAEAVDIDDEEDADVALGALEDDLIEDWVTDEDEELTVAEHREPKIIEAELVEEPERAPATKEPVKPKIEPVKEPKAAEEPAPEAAKAKKKPTVKVEKVEEKPAEKAKDKSEEKKKK